MTVSIKNDGCALLIDKIGFNFFSSPVICECSWNKTQIEKKEVLYRSICGLFDMWDFNY